MGGSKRPERASAIPEDAIWDENDECYTAGPTDAQGRRQGLWRCWYRSGRVYGEATYLDGEQHGTMWCELGAAGETPFDKTFAVNVHRLEQDYDRGCLARQRCFTRDGKPVGTDGEPLPPRPEGLPAEAFYVTAQEIWVDTAIIPVDGRQRLWGKDGVLLADGQFAECQRHGLTRTWIGTRRIEADVEGPSATDVADVTYEHGTMVRAVLRDEHDNVLVDAQFADGNLDGTLTWHVNRHGFWLGEIIKWSGGSLLPAELLGKHGIPGAVRAEARFADGKLVEVHAFAASGAELFPPAKVTDFGQSTKPAQIAGYIARGELARDLQAFFPNHPRADIDEAAARGPKLFAKLRDHRQAAEGLHELASGKRFPHLVCCNLDAYGFDTVANELEGLTDARYFGLAYDGSGNMQFLDLETGKVVGYEHEEGILDPERELPTLDAWAFAMPRVELARIGRVDVRELKKLFERLRLAAGVFELGTVS